MIHFKRGWSRMLRKHSINTIYDLLQSIHFSMIFWKFNRFCACLQHVPSGLWKNMKLLYVLWKTLFISSCTTFRKINGNTSVQRLITNAQIVRSMKFTLNVLRNQISLTTFKVVDQRVGLQNKHSVIAENEVTEHWWFILYCRLVITNIDIAHHLPKSWVICARNESAICVQSSAGSPKCTDDNDVSSVLPLSFFLRALNFPAETSRRISTHDQSTGYPVTWCDFTYYYYFLWDIFSEIMRSLMIIIGLIQEEIVTHAISKHLKISERVGRKHARHNYIKQDFIGTGQFILHRSMTDFREKDF